MARVSGRGKQSHASGASASVPGVVPESDASVKTGESSSSGTAAQTAQPSGEGMSALEQAARSAEQAARELDK